MIPPVTRTAGGIRDYSETDVRWVTLAKCMRAAGLPISVMVKYVKLYAEGEQTHTARLQLLVEQRNALLEQRKQIDETLARLETKIEHYTQGTVKLK